MSIKSVIFVSALVVGALLPQGSVQAGEWVSDSASSAAGSRNYSLWVPSAHNKRKPAALIVMLHGCMQTPQQLAAISGMNSVADKNNFLVVYPEQAKTANALQCWNWFDTKHQTRDAGEPSILAAIVAQVRLSHRLDSKRMYVAGISAGGAMAVVLGVTYPDIFTGIGVHSGLAFKAATDLQSGLAAMKEGGKDSERQAVASFETLAKAIKLPRRMPVFVLHGEADPYLNPKNAGQLIDQWAITNDYLDDRKLNHSVKSTPGKTLTDAVGGGHSFTREIYYDRSGKPLLEKWMIKQLGHAWSGSPVAGPFADPKGPNASEEMWRFFVESKR